MSRSLYVLFGIVVFDKILPLYRQLRRSENIRSDKRHNLQ